MKLGYPTITWGGVVGMPSGVTSVKDLFYRTNGSTEQAVRAIAAAGFEGVEVFDGNLTDYEASPRALLDLLEELGTPLVGVYTGANFVYDEILEDELYKIARASDLAAAFGARTLVVGGGAKRPGGPHDGDFDRLAAGLDRAAELAAAAGLTASYHPHLGTLVEGPDALGEVMARSSIAFCPDTAHLAAGGGDPATLIRRYADRLAHVHLKDLDRATTTFLPLGRGDLDFPGILAAVRDAGYDGWLMVELDAYDGDPAEAAQISKAYLDRLLSA